MNSTQLAACVPARTAECKAHADAAVRVLPPAFADAVAGGETRTLAGFRTFLTQSQLTRHRRIATTGEHITVAASHTPAFKAERTSLMPPATHPGRNKLYRQAQPSHSRMARPGRQSPFASPLTSADCFSAVPHC